MTGPASLLGSRRHGGLSEFSSGRGKDSDCGDAEGERAAAPACCCRYTSSTRAFSQPPEPSASWRGGAGAGAGRAAVQDVSFTKPGPPAAAGSAPRKEARKGCWWQWRKHSEIAHYSWWEYYSDSTPRIYLVNSKRKLCNISFKLDLVPAAPSDTEFNSSQR